MTNWPATCLTDWQIITYEVTVTNWLIVPLTYMYQVTDWLTNWVTDLLTDWLRTNWETALLTEKLANWLSDVQTEWLTDWETD